MMKTDSRLTIVPLEELTNLISPVFDKLNQLDKKLDKKDSKQFKKGYYRNKDLKALFGLSPNTIIKYRDTGILPYTVLGEVYLYPINKINDVLMKNLNY